MKKVAGWVVLKYVEKGSIVGVGMGLIVNYFIDVLGIIKDEIKGVVLSLIVLIVKLEVFGICVYDCNDVLELDIYVDGVDEINLECDMIKGGGVVLMCEKIVVVIVKKFVCIVDGIKVVDVLGNFFLFVEVILMVCFYVVCELVKFGGDFVYCEGVIIDNGNVILDVYNMKIIYFKDFESKINGIVGVVIVGFFVYCGVDVVIIGIL